MNVIYDNIIFSLQKAGGISVYWTELLKQWQFLKCNLKLVSDYKCDNLLRKELDFYHSYHSGKKNKFLYLLRYLPVVVKGDKNTIFHSSYYRTTCSRKIRNVVTIHDFTYEKYFSGLRLIIHKLQKGKAIKKAAGIICVSENTKRDLLYYYPKTDIRKIKVIYHGYNEIFRRLSEIERSVLHSIAKYPFVLFVGSRVSYKNFDSLVKAVSFLDNYSLVIVGGGDLTESERISLQNQINDRFVHLSGIDNIALNNLYNQAFCLAYPSEYEGFGIPVLESMSAGCPVVAMKKSSIPEVGGDAILYVENNSPFEISEKIHLLEDTNIRNYYISRGLERAKLFSWNKCFKDTFDFYNDIIEENLC